MPAAQLRYEDVNIGDLVRPLYLYMDQMMLIEWGEISGNSDSGHWHTFSNRWKDTDDPEVSVKEGFDASVTGQFKMACLERMLYDWAGPKSWVQSMDVQYRVWDTFHELKTLRGTVTGKNIEGDLALVNVSLEMLREDGRPTTLGTAAIALPRT